MANPFPALSALRVLVVEDEAMIVLMLEDILEQFGCRVDVAPSIEKAVEALGRRVPDGVLLDMNIRGRKPVAVLDELVSRRVPFLLVTGYGAADADPPLIRTAPRLQKPFNPDELGRRMVEVFVGAAGTRAAAGAPAP